MRIQRYRCESRGDDLTYSEVKFKNVNLIVGDSAAGKSRLMNTIFNLGRFAVSDELHSGYWDIEFSIEGQTYRWELDVSANTLNIPASINNEQISIINGTKKRLLVKRNGDEFIFDGKSLPKLSPQSCAISLLREENEIKPIYEGFSNIRRRSFSGDALAKFSRIDVVPPQLLENLKSQSIKSIIAMGLGVNICLYILKQSNKKVFEKIINYFCDIFPFVKVADIKTLDEIDHGAAVPTIAPCFCIQEKNSTKWIQVKDLSSGMQKVLLILFDILTLQPNGIYMIDEYENSLGISAIDFFPDFLDEEGEHLQVFLTSHHPWLINHMPIKNWYLLNRQGMDVSIYYGEELIERFGQSRQQYFTQLINDPLYKGAKD